MDCKDLQIGDWVLFGRPCKIAQMGIGKAVLDWEEGVLVDYSEIKSIPLTPEILEKNGFKYSGNNTLKGADIYQLRHEQNGFDYTITIKLNDWFAVDSYDDREYRIFEMETGRWNVHELQHALRLCGIDKEITL